jgi:hypothetical protein
VLDTHSPAGAPACLALRIAMALVTGAAGSGMPAIRRPPALADTWMKARRVSLMNTPPSPQRCGLGDPVVVDRSGAFDRLDTFQGDQFALIKRNADM